MKTALLLLALLSAGAATAAGPVSDPKSARALIDEAVRINGQDRLGSIRRLDRALSLLQGPRDGELRRLALGKKCWSTAFGDDPGPVFPIASPALAEAEAVRDSPGP